MKGLLHELVLGAGQHGQVLVQLAVLQGEGELLGEGPQELQVGLLEVAGELLPVGEDQVAERGHVFRGGDRDGHRRRPVIVGYVRGERSLEVKFLRDEDVVVGQRVLEAWRQGLERGLLHDLGRHTVHGPRDERGVARHLGQQGELHHGGVEHDPNVV